MSRGCRVLLAAYAAVVWLQQPPAGPLDAVRREDVYAIYSRLLDDAGSAVYLIGATTVSGSTPSILSDEPCISLPPEYDNRWKEVLAEYDRRKDNPETLERAFKITKPYFLLTQGEAKAFLDSLKGSTPQPQDPRFQGTRALYELGTVYFDRNRTLALTAISITCGSLCGSGGWRVFERDAGGQWILMLRRGEGANCSDWIA